MIIGEIAYASLEKFSGQKQIGDHPNVIYILKYIKFLIFAEGSTLYDWVLTQILNLHDLIGPDSALPNTAVKQN